MAIPLSENDVSDVRLTLSVREAARILGIGRNAAYEGVRNGQLPAIKIGRRVVIPRAALERLLKGAMPGKAT